MDQDYPADRFEVLVVDDGSPGDAVRRAVELAGRPSQVHYLRIPHAGAAAARNHGIEAARGAIVAFTDDDCIPNPDWLSEIAAVFTETAASGVAGLTWPINRENLVARFLDMHGALRKSIVQNQTGRIDVVPTANAAYRRDALLAVNGFDDTYEKTGLSYGGEDRTLTWRLLREGYEIQLSVKAQVGHEHRTTLRQMLLQGYHYGRGNYLHSLIAQEPPDYEPSLRTALALVWEYLIPYRQRVHRYSSEGASLPDALLFPLLDFLRRFATFLGAYSLHRRAGRVLLEPRSRHIH